MPHLKELCRTLTEGTERPPLESEPHWDAAPGAGPPPRAPRCRVPREAEEAEEAEVGRVGSEVKEQSVSKSKETSGDLLRDTNQKPLEWAKCVRESVSVVRRGVPVLL